MELLKARLWYSLLNAANPQVDLPVPWGPVKNTVWVQVLEPVEEEVEDEFD